MSETRDTRRPRRASLALLALPVAFIAVEILTRAVSGPFWMWHTLDPSYFYVFDSLNLVNLTTPGHPFHPGTTVQWLGAITLKAIYPFTGAAGITEAVLADPEGHLRIMGDVLITLIATALLAAGWTAYRVFGDMLAALIVQTGPFLSMLMVNHATGVKPEPLLVVTVLALTSVTLLALKDRAVTDRAGRFAIAFGIIAGFGVATKITSAPIFILPLFILARPRTIFIYAAVSLAALIVFTLPAAGAYGQMLDWFARVITSAGVYDTGAKAVIDPGAYLVSFYGLFRRPAFNVILVVSIIGLIVARRRPGPGIAYRALLGVVAAQVFHAVIIAKQPTAYYMIPAFMLIPLAAVLVYDLAGGRRDREGRRRPAWQKAVAVLLVALIAAQGVRINDNTRELAARRLAAARIDDGAFKSCARIFYFAASNPVYALFKGNWESGLRFSSQLKAMTGRNDFWYETEVDEIRNWDGRQDAAAIIGAYECVYMRGLRAHSGPLRAHLAAAVPDFKFDDACSTGAEAIFTAGVDCKGRPKT